MEEVKVLYQNEVTQLNPETGEIIGYVKNKTVVLPKEPNFVKLYLEDLLYFADCPLTHRNLINSLLGYATYNNKASCMRVHVSGGLKKEIAEELNIKVHTIQNALTDLVKGNVLLRVGSGSYDFNPYFFGKGSWKEIHKARIEIDYDEINGRTFKSSIERKKEVEHETE